MSDKLHTMDKNSLTLFCSSKVHPLIEESGLDALHIIPEYRRDKVISVVEKRGKIFNYKRPTAEIIGGRGYLYVFPGRDYVRHYSKIYKQLGYTVTVDPVNDGQSSSTIASLFPAIPNADVAVLGYVDAIAGEDRWNGNKDISWKLESIGGKSVLFLGVTFSYWGDLIYHIVEQLAAKVASVIYLGKLGSLHLPDVPNRTIASGNNSIVEGSVISWDNVFDSNPLVSFGNHVTVPSILDETDEWFTVNRGEYRFVDPEIGWAAKSCEDNKIGFSYLHLVTDNLCGDFIDDLTNERSNRVVNKRLQYVGIMKAILWNAIASDKDSLYAAVLQAQQKRVDRTILKPLQRDWEACLSFARHMGEEAWEVVCELPRKEWKHQDVVPERVLAEVADVQIQLLTTLAYAGYTDSDLKRAVFDKLGTNRPDWK